MKPLKSKRIKKFKVVKPTDFIPGSYSSIKKYELCARWFYIEKVLKVKGGSGAGAERGEKMHKALENFLKGTRKTLPKEVADFADDLAELKKQKGLMVEDEWAFDNHWEPVAWKHAEVYMRMKLDAMYPMKKDAMMVIDFKTGKVKESEHVEQAGLYALGTFIHHPEVKRVTVEFWYLDHDEVLVWQFNRKDMKKLQRNWEFRLMRVNRDERFKPSPSGLCPPSLRNLDWEGCPHNPYGTALCEHGERKAEELVMLNDMRKKK